jgi:hypothetical protein
MNLPRIVYQHKAQSFVDPNSFYIISLLRSLSLLPRRNFLGGQGKECFYSVQEANRTQATMLKFGIMARAPSRGLERLAIIYLNIFSLTGYLKYNDHYCQKLSK